MAEKDYSSTPLWKKLGIGQGARVLFSGAPSDFAERLGPLPAGIVARSRAVPGGSIDVVMVFSHDSTDLARRLPSLVRALDHDGGLWVAWPKKASKVKTDLTFEIVQGMGLSAGLVDNKSASIDDVYQGLRFVYRLKDRPGGRR